MDQKNKDSINYLFTIHNNCIDNIKLADQKATGLITINSIIFVGLSRVIDPELQYPIYIKIAIVITFFALLISIILPILVIFPRVTKVTKEVQKRKKQELLNTDSNFINPCLISFYQPQVFQYFKKIIYDDFKNFEDFMKEGRSLTDEKTIHKFNEKLVNQLLEYIYILSIVNNIKYSRLKVAIISLIVSSILSIIVVSPSYFFFLI